MIDKTIYGIDYIKELQTQYRADPGLIERSLYAFGLLEAIQRVEMPFCFKGGTSLMLILNHPARLSTDIDIQVDPGTDVDSYIAKAATLFPFTNLEEDVRKGRNGIVKRHFRFTYYSPVRKTDFYILLDIVFAPLPYAKTVKREIRNDLLLTTGDDLSVVIPTAECLLGDKLTAFAPHTTGVPLGKGRELEIAKQLFDVASLMDHLMDFNMFAETYQMAVNEEASFRGEQWTITQVLQDTIDSCATIISRGAYGKDDYPELLKGIKSLKNHILLDGYNTDNATWRACKVMYLASSLLSGNPLVNTIRPEDYIHSRLEGVDYKKLAYIRKQNPEAYAYLVEATRNLSK